jgi:hypothetical protein
MDRTITGRRATGRWSWRRTGCRGARRCRTPVVALLAAGLCAVVLAGVAAEALAAGTHRSWVRRFALTPPVFEPASACVAGDGSVSLCGVHVATTTPPQDYDGFLVTYRRSGSRWLRTYRHDPVTPTSEVFQDVATDKYGNIYVCGYTSAAPTATDALLVKYSRDGTVRWKLTHDHLSAGAVDVAVALMVTPGGTVFVAGSTGGIPFTTSGWLVMKVSAGGYVRWAETYVGPAGHDAATSIARDSRGNILVSGTSRSAAGDDDCVTLCFDRTSGARAWPGEARFARPGNEADPRVLADPRGGLFVALESDLNAGAGDDVVLLRYDGNGTRRWARRYDGPDHRPEDVSGAAVDAAGNVYIAGRSERAAGPQYSALAMRYTRGGTRRWVKLYRDFAGGREASFYDVTVDSRRRPYFAGVVGSGAAENALLRAYAPTGKVRWRDEYDSPFANQDAFYRVEAWRSSAVYALGGCLAGVGPPFDLRGLVIRYRP